MFEALNALRFIDMIHSRVSHGDFVDPVPSFPHHGPQVVALTAAARLHQRRHGVLSQVERPQKDPIIGIVNDFGIQMEDRIL